MRYFNTAGPCQPDFNYMIPAAARLPEASRLVEQRGYFVLHAPRQSGKTTTLLEMAKELTNSGRYCALLVSLEAGAVFRDNLEALEDSILDVLRSEAKLWLPQELHPPAWAASVTGRRVVRALQDWAHACPRPLVLFLDEIDALEDAALLSVCSPIFPAFCTATRESNSRATHPARLFSPLDPAVKRQSATVEFFALQIARETAR